MKILAATLSSLMLVACGGSGGGGVSPPASVPVDGGGGGGVSTPAPGPVGSTPSFPLQTGYKALMRDGFSKTFTISGTCTGTGTKTSSPADTPATFEGVTGFSSANTLSMSLTNCTPASSTVTSTTYVDTNYVTLGYNINDVYGVYKTPPVIPTSVTAGETGPIGTQTLYTNITNRTPSGSIVLSYEIAAGTSNTALVNFIAKNFDATSLLTLTEQNRFLMDANGTLTPVSSDILFATGTHYIFTYKQ